MEMERSNTGKLRNEIEDLICTLARTVCDVSKCTKADTDAANPILQKLRNDPAVLTLM